MRPLNHIAAVIRGSLMAALFVFARLDATQVVNAHFLEATALVDCCASVLELLVDKNRWSAFERVMTSVLVWLMVFCLLWFVFERRLIYLVLAFCLLFIVRAVVSTRVDALAVGVALPVLFLLVIVATAQGGNYLARHWSLPVDTMSAAILTAVVVDSLVGLLRWRREAGTRSRLVQPLRAGA